MSTFLHYVHCKDALLDCSAPGGERCESLTWVDEIIVKFRFCPVIGLIQTWGQLLNSDNTDWSPMAALANTQPVSMCEPQADRYELIQNLMADFS